MNSLMVTGDSTTTLIFPYEATSQYKTYDTYAFSRQSVNIPFLSQYTSKVREFQCKLDICKSKHNKLVSIMCPIPKKVGFLKPCFPLKEEEPPAAEKDISYLHVEGTSQSHGPASPNLQADCTMF